MCEDVCEDVLWGAFHSVLHICEDAFDVRGWILVQEWMCVVSVTWTGGVLDAWCYVGIESKSIDFWSTSS